MVWNGGSSGTVIDKGGMWTTWPQLRRFLLSAAFCFVSVHSFVSPPSDIPFTTSFMP